MEGLAVNETPLVEKLDNPRPQLYLSILSDFLCSCQSRHAAAQNIGRICVFPLSSRGSRQQKFLRNASKVK